MGMLCTTYGDKGGEKACCVPHMATRRGVGGMGMLCTTYGDKGGGGGWACRVPHVALTLAPILACVWRPPHEKDRLLGTAET